MAGRRELIESEDFQRRRGVAALVRGDDLAIDDVPRRPNAALVVGVVVVVLVAAISAASAFLTDRPPDGWRDEGAVVVDRETGARYLATDGLLRPAPTLTAALLAGGRRGEPVLVPHSRVLTMPVGTALPGDGLPQLPPALGAPVPLAACATGPDRDAPDRVAVYAGPVVGPATAFTGFLARASGTAGTVLVAGGRAHPVDPGALPLLGWSPTQVREVPGPWLGLLPRGGTLSPREAPGAVVATTDGARYVLDRGRARLVADETTARLLPTPARTVVPDEVLALPAGPVAGIADVPSAPPVVPAREDTVVPCVTRGGDSPTLQVFGAVASPGLAAGPERLLAGGERPARVTWHVPPGGGALLAPPGFDAAARRDDPEGIVLVDAGLGFGVDDDEALRALGYAREQVLPIRPGWFALLAAGPRLAVPD
ncbi:type VII secretion protein EccB [Actinomycetospora termitidis]|uniref:Type VII secretion protein EccB n=1 Tax=Actinomycetospora termitidis TaxID=3053470 RepID=A0ABT7M572_9PSEU|nr:type VII secretion protein EccB [Actinomycetospora sp. Odt1-22]MDL5155811.1 type VII secretion protein EccB [Actinomycetospora sp. Odt1-22]